MSHATVAIRIIFVYYHRGEEVLKGCRFRKCYIIVERIVLLSMSTYIQQLRIEVIWLRLVL